MADLTRRRFIQTAGLTAAVPVAGAAMTQGQSPVGSDVRVENDIRFGQGGDVDLYLDIYHPPAGTEKRTATIHIHGGGFSRGSKDSVSRAAPFYAQLGHVGIAAAYRLSGEASWPAQLDDVKAAIRWTRANADRLNIDADRIAVAGYSAGGLMALFAGATGGRPEFEGQGGTPGVSSHVSACVGYYPGTDTPDFLLPEDADASSRAAAVLSSWITADFPPTLLFHGVDDTVVPLESSQRLFDRLRELEVPVELHSFEGQPHIFDRDAGFGAACANLTDLFYGRHLK